MTFTIETKNLGRLPEIPIEIGGLTVLAGPNATGKSFLSKVLYSIFSAMNENHALMYVQDAINPVKAALSRLNAIERHHGSNPDIDEFRYCLRQVEEICQSLTSQEGDLYAVESIHENLISETEGALKVYKKVHAYIQEQVKRLMPPNFAERTLDQMGKGIDGLKALANKLPEEIIDSGFKLSLERNLTGNFQVSSLAELKKDAEKDLLINVDGIANISIKDDVFLADLTDEGLMNSRRHSSVIYLESPILWKLQGALKVVRGRLFSHNWRMNITVPKYFYDLDEAINQKYAGEIAFPELFEKLTGKKVLGGKISLGEGEWKFIESGNSSGRSFSLPLAATGAVNLGMIALLIERRLIDEGTFLFIDEPESNLHPKWQVVMIETLIELAKGGVNVVIATHSADIVERLSALAKRNSELERLISLNHFSRDCMKDECENKSFHRTAGDILKELTDAYSDSYMIGQGLKHE